jgi:hypothetical protein
MCAARKDPAPRRGAVVAGIAVLASLALSSDGWLSTAQACDLHLVYNPTTAIYTTTEEREDRTGLRLGMAEQFTAFRTLRLNSHTVPNPAGERLNSSITQLVAGYNFHPRFGVQLNLPIIARWFRRLTKDGVEDGDVSGIGDLSLLAIGKPVSWTYEDAIAHLTLLGGLKLPSGNSNALREEIPSLPCIPFPFPCPARPSPRLGARSERRSEPERVPVPPHLYPHHDNGPPSGIHGHDLALGSGSVDGIVGGQVFGSWRRAFATASVQYFIRGTGSFDYRYANDLLFSVGPGAYVLTGSDWLGAPYTFRAQVLFGGETKGNDSIDGEPETGSAVTALYLGPMFGFAWGVHLGAELGAEFPVLQHNTGLQIMPDYRLRGGFTWRF